MARTKTDDTPVVLDNQATIDGEIPEWATPDPADQQLVASNGPIMGQTRRHLVGAELLQWVAAQISRYEDDDPRMALEIASQIAAASNLDEILSDVDTTKGKEILDTILEVNAVKFVMSSEPGGCPYFALLSARDTKTGELHTVSVGGWKLVLQLGQLHYITTRLEPTSEFLVPDGTPDSISPETYPVYFRIRTKPTNTPGRSINYLARVTD